MFSEMTIWIVTNGLEPGYHDKTFCSFYSLPNHDDSAAYLFLQLSLKVVDQMLKLGWEGDGLSPLIK